jgi:hypothetical protein
MLIIFELEDKTKRKIYLTKERWKHITDKHPYMTNFLEEVKETIADSQNIVPHDEGELYDYCKYYKQRKGKLKFLKAVVKYLNGTGFVLSAYFVTHINE